MNTCGYGRGSPPDCPSFLLFSLASKMSSFSNCSEFNENQMATLAALRGGTSAVAAMFALVLLVVTCACRSRLGKEDKRLKVCLFFLFGVSITYLTVLSLGAVNRLLPAPTARKWCAAFGFLDQILSVVQMTSLFIATGPIMSALWSEIARGCKKECYRKKWLLRVFQGTVILIAVMIVISSFVPFITDTYGEIGSWCWIVNIDEDCEVLVVGLVQQLFLWIIYHAFISFICTLMVMTAVILFLKICYNKNRNNIDDKHNDYKHIFWKYIFQLVILVPIFVDFADLSFVFGDHVHHYSFTKWVLFATAPPISALLIPLSFLMYIKFGNDGSSADQKVPIQAEHDVSRDCIPTSFVTADENPSWVQRYGGTEQLDQQTLLKDH